MAPTTTTPRFRFLACAALACTVSLCFACESGEQSTEGSSTGDDDSAGPQTPAAEPSTGASGARPGPQPAAEVGAEGGGGTDDSGSATAPSSPESTEGSTGGTGGAPGRGGSGATTSTVAGAGTVPPGSSSGSGAVAEPEPNPPAVPGGTAGSTGVDPYGCSCPPEQMCVRHEVPTTPPSDLTASPDTPPPPPPRISQTACYEGAVTCLAGCCVDENGTSLCNVAFPDDTNALDRCYPTNSPMVMDCSYRQ
jgi:hypothetical protein